MKTLHEEFYDFRDRVWKAFEKLVQEGCEFIGDFPVIEQYNSKEYIIKGIIADKNYQISPNKQSEKDITVTINKIKIKTVGDTEIEIEPNILDLQTLATYVSGGYKCYTE